MRIWGCALALAAASAQGQHAGSKSCAPCHAAQYESFQRTPMGRSLSAVASTVAPEFSKPVQFFHPKTGRRYRVFRKPGELLIEESLVDRNRQVVYSDRRRVSYAIGSGNHARSFLVEQPGRLYQAPVTFFKRAGHWDMSPGYDTEDYVGFTRRVTANCLFCHAGRVNTQNQAGDIFQTSAPFAETPIGCERCHGPGMGHVAQPDGAIVNPAKLSPDLRDQVCEQCHLFGSARVAQPGRSPADYRPGEPLGAFLAIYAYDAAAREPTLTGHPREMEQSICRQRSQGKLWCGSCHEVHAKAAYRAKCLGCHARNACSRRPDPWSVAHRADNCIACHMPKRQVIESAHVSFTDHRILRRPKADVKPQVVGTRLRLILPAEMDDPVAATRNLGFAYAELASSTGRGEHHRKVVETLQPLVGTAVADAAFWQTLGEAHLASGDSTQAEGAFRQAIALDPDSASANYSLGYLFQLGGKAPEAIQAYRRALEADPYKSEALGNLAAAYLQMGEHGEAAKTLARALKLEPGNLRWRAIQSAPKIGISKSRPGK